MRVLVVHNRYRLSGGEERAVELQRDAFDRAGIEHAALLRDSGDIGRLRAGASMLRGGYRESEVADAARSLGADVVHVHNMQPLFGPRALGAARGTGARVVLQLHNFRLFCSIAVAFRDGAPCFRCRRGLTLPGLALNCRGSLAESAVYAASLSQQLGTVLRTVDRFVTLSGYAAGQLVRLGVPEDRLSVVPNYLPDALFAERSQADRGAYALVASRLSQEKGIETAIEAARLANVPLKIAGDGPLRARLAGADLLGRVSSGQVRELLDGAAMALVPSLGGDVMPYAALEAMARGVPVVASRSGSLPEIVGADRCVPRARPAAMARAMSVLWDDAGRRRRQGDELLGRARELFDERRYVAELRRIYDELRSAA